MNRKLPPVMTPLTDKESARLGRMIIDAIAEDIAHIIDRDMPIHIRWSIVAVAHGWGSDPWKWVSNLSKDEREYVRSGGILLMDGCPRSKGKHNTSIRRIVSVGKYKFGHRVPSDEIMDAVKESRM